MDVIGELVLLLTLLRRCLILAEVRHSSFTCDINYPASLERKKFESLFFPLLFLSCLSTFYHTFRLACRYVQDSLCIQIKFFCSSAKL